jgi:hypothetical protein
MTFEATDGDFSPSGVRISRDFRDNLIIDRYDPVFADMRASKIKHLRSANSEDAVTWNVFRSLRQLTPGVWLPTIWKAAFPDAPLPSNRAVCVNLWPSIAPPLGLLEYGDESASEIDVVIESATWVWFLEAKYGADISIKTTTRSTRDQILRYLDVGSYYAGVRDFYFSFLVLTKEKSPHGWTKLQEYSDFERVRQLLSAHRPDGMRNLRSISGITWNQVANVLRIARESASRADEREYADRALRWLASKQIVPTGVDQTQG